jgi:hypothetical protein
MSITYSVNEQSTAFWDFSLVDEDEDAIALASLDTLTLTLTDDLTGAVLNSRSAQNVLNVNNVTVSAQGAVSWEMTPADNAIVGSPVPDGGETHTAVFTWTWDGGTRSQSYVFKFSVTKVARVGVDSAAETTPLPALTGDTLVDTLNSLIAQRLQIARAGPKPSYSLHGHKVDWTQYLEYLDKRILALRQEINQTDPWEEVGYGI